MRERLEKDMRERERERENISTVQVSRCESR